MLNGCFPFWSSRATDFESEICHLAASGLAGRGQSSLFEQERQGPLRTPVDCRIRQESRMNVPLQR
jgi:hypothetical protein